MTGNEPTLEDVVERMLHACERLCGIVVLVVYVQVVVFHGITALLREQVVVDEWLCGLRGELHHHSSRRVGIHVGVLARDIVILGIDDFQEQVARLGPARHAAFLPIVDVASCHLLAGALHQFQFHLVLDVLDAHLAAATLTDTVGDALNERLILSGWGCQHRLADRRFDFFLVIADDTAITLQYCLNHILGAKNVRFINCYRKKRYLPPLGLQK